MSVYVSTRTFELSEATVENVISDELSAAPINDRAIALSVAETRDEKAQATELLNRRFGWRGYGSDHKLGSGAQNTTFLAQLDEEIVGTITLGVDGLEGLGIDAVFKDEIDKFRAAPGVLVCELKKFAFDHHDKDYSNISLASLFHIVYLYSKGRHDCTDLFIEVNPRHRRFYQAMLGFTPIGEMRTNESVGAPSQLMWLNISKIAEQIAHHRTAGHKSRSLYALFLSEAEETLVKSRLDLRRNFPGMDRCMIKRPLPVKHHAQFA